MRKETRIIAEIAILVGLAVVLDLLAGLFSPFKQGGSISPAMLPIFIIAFRHGWKKGMFAGFIFALLQMVLGLSEIIGWIYDPTPFKIWFVVFFDYIIPFTLLGVAGFFKEPFKKPWSFILGISLGVFIRYICHGLSGVVVWGNFAADWGIGNVWVYSFVFYNLPYMASSFALCLLIGLSVYKRGVWDYRLNTIK